MQIRKWNWLTNGQWFWALICSLLLTWQSCCNNNRVAGGLMHHNAHVTSPCLSGYPGYFREPHWILMGLPEISRGIEQVCVTVNNALPSPYMLSEPLRVWPQQIHSMTAIVRTQVLFVPRLIRFLYPMVRQEKRIYSNRNDIGWYLHNCYQPVTRHPQFV